MAWKNLTASVLTFGLLAGATAEMISLSSPPDAGPYHATVREARERVVTKFGDWIAQDAPVPESAVKLLRPNVTVSQQWTNVLTGRRASFLIVQCADARDLVGHYPPVCYVNQGFRELEATPTEWAIGDEAVTGIEYRYGKSSFDGTSSLYVSNFMVMPDGRFMRDMAAVREQAADLHKRFYGAAQVQVVLDGAVPAAERREIVRALVGGNWAMVDAIRSGGRDERVE